MPHLPLELVRMVVTNVATVQAPLHPLLFVSKEFLHEACRELYRHVVIKETHKRQQLPMNNATKRSYYASLVENITIHSCRLFNDIRRILHTVQNLKTLEILGKDFSTIQYVLRPDYPFELDSFTCDIHDHPRLIEFVQSQPTIRTIFWDPGFYRTLPAFRTAVEAANFLPNLENMKTEILFLSSGMFSVSKVKRLHLDASNCYYNVHPLLTESTVASRNVTSLVLLSDAFSLDRILVFFPNLRYLEGNWSFVSLHLVRIDAL